MHARTALALAVGLAVCSCGPREASFQNDTAIVNGSTDTTHDAVVMLAHAPNGGLSPFCSAVVIAPRVALTAAHCLPSTFNDSTGLVYSDMRDLVIAVGPDLLHVQTTIPVAAVHPNPGYAPKGYASSQVITDENDIALLYLSADAPVTPLPLYEPMMGGLSAGTSVTLVGYGDDGHGNGATRRSGTATIDQVYDRVFSMTAAPSTLCSGDSGGAALVTVGGVQVVAGVNYRADCVKTSIDTRVDAFFDSLIQPYLSGPQSAECGNGACEPGETAATCPGDCCDATSACGVTYRGAEGGYVCEQISNQIVAFPWNWVQPGAYQKTLCDDGWASCPACATDSPSCVSGRCGGACAAGTGNVAGSGSGCTLHFSAPSITDIGDLAIYPGAQAAVRDALDGGWMTPCSGDATSATFCPHETVTRGEAVAILVRALFGDTPSLSGAPWSPVDVGASDWRLPFIQKAYEVGITHGTSATTFAPDAPMTREQMAALVVRAWSIANGYGAEGFPPAACAHPLFGDVPRSDVFFPYVQKLRELGITSGTSGDPLTYGPAGSSERWQVAVFVDRAFGTASPAPAPCCPNTECTQNTCGQLLPVTCTNDGSTTHLACGC